MDSSYGTAVLPEREWYWKNGRKWMKPLPPLPPGTVPRRFIISKNPATAERINNMSDEEMKRTMGLHTSMWADKPSADVSHNSTSTSTTSRKEPTSPCDRAVHELAPHPTLTVAPVRESISPKKTLVHPKPKLVVHSDVGRKDLKGIQASIWAPKMSSNRAPFHAKDSNVNVVKSAPGNQVDNFDKPRMMVSVTAGFDGGMDLVKNTIPSTSISVPKQNAKVGITGLIENPALPPHMWVKEPEQTKSGSISNTLITGITRLATSGVVPSSGKSAKSQSGKAVRPEPAVEYESVLFEDPNVSPHLWIKKLVPVGNLPGELTNPSAITKPSLSLTEDNSTKLDGVHDRAPQAAGHTLCEDFSEFEKFLAAGKAKKGKLHVGANRLRPYANKAPHTKSTGLKEDCSTPRHNTTSVKNTTKTSQICSTHREIDAFSVEVGALQQPNGSASGPVEFALEFPQQASKAIQGALVRAPKAAGSEEIQSSLNDTIQNLREDYEVLNKASDPRMILAPIPHELQDFNGGFAPLPFWDDGQRPALDGTFKSAYIEVWSRNLEPPKSRVDVQNPDFASGVAHILSDILEPPYTHGPAYPCIGDSANAGRQMKDTAQKRSQHFINVAGRKAIERAHIEEICAMNPAYNTPFPDEPDPNAPTVELYIRPAHEADATGISQIYNWYVQHTIVPEDQKVVDEEAIRNKISEAKGNRTPIIVAIQGKAPEGHLRKPMSTFGRRSTQANTGAKASHPAVTEFVLGFGFVDGFSGLTGVLNQGRSRFTGQLHFYVRQQQLRQGIGRCLLDRLLTATAPSHLNKGGYVFSNPSNDQVYEGLGGNGPHRFHQLIVQRPIERSQDPDYDWLKMWLEKSFFFEETGRLKSVGRSSVGTSTISRFLDIVQFQFDASNEAEHAGC